MAPQGRSAKTLALYLLALLLAAPLLAAPPALTPHRTMVLQVGHSGDITAFAYSPDGQTLATGGDDGVRLWDAAGGQVKAILDGADGPLAFSPDGQTLGTGSQDYTARLWDVTSGQLKASLRLDLASLDRLTFSPDGQVLATGGDRGYGAEPEVELWDVSSGQLRTSLEPDLFYLDRLAFSADSRTVATGGAVSDGWGGYRTGPAELWDVESGQLKVGFDGALGSFAYSPDGQTLATGSDDGVRLWDSVSGRLKATLDVGGLAGELGNYPWLPPFAFSPDGRTLAARADDDDSQVRLWDVVSGQARATLAGHQDPIRVLAFSLDGKTLATGSDDETAKLWDVASGKLRATLQGHTDTVYLLAFAPGGETLATGGYGSYDGNSEYVDGTVRLWDVVSGRLKGVLEGRGDERRVNGITLSPDGRTLATRDGVGVRLWDPASGQLKATLTGVYNPGFPNPVFSPESKTLAIVSRDATTGSNLVQLWDVDSAQLKATLKDANGPPIFSPNGVTLATGGSGGVQLWDVASGRLKVTLTGAYVALTFSPDSKALATENYNAATKLRAVQLWDVASGQLKATLEDADVAFSFDSKTLAARDLSGQLHLWDVASAGPILITAQTSLAQFPPWLTHPFSWKQGEPEVSLLDPVDEHVLATLQPLPDAPASLFAPPPDPAAAPTGSNWITTTPDGYFEGSANLAPFIRWNVDGALYPAPAYWDLYYRPDLVRQALRTPGG